MGNNLGQIKSVFDGDLHNKEWNIGLSLTTLRFSSTFSSPMDSSLVPTVPVDSSHARRPKPGRTIFAAVSFSSSEYFSRLIFREDVLLVPESLEEGVKLPWVLKASKLDARAERARMFREMFIVYQDSMN